MWVVPPPLVRYTIESLPVVVSSGAKIPFARVEPAGKLIVEVAGLLVMVLVTDANPALFGPTKVRLPVIAVAVGGTGPRGSVIWRVRAEFAVNLPGRPTSVRVSSARNGMTLVNVAPETSARK